MEADIWRPYSYVWNDDQTDAILAETGGETKTIVQRAQGGARQVNYRIHAQTECAVCHNPWVEKRTMVFGVQSASPLGVKTPQLNKRCDIGTTSSNQLTLLHQMALLDWAPDVAKLPRLVDPYDESGDLDRRVRSYLQSNCAHCHQANAGGTAAIELAYDLPLEQTKTVGVRPIQGTFNIARARIIAPGDPSGSVLYYRVSKLGGGRMPRVGSNQVDEQATRMIRDWIAAMPAPKPGTPVDGVTKTAREDRDALKTLMHADRLSASDRTTAIGRLASSTRGALMLVGLIDRAHALESLRREVVEITRNSQLVEVRDLFERFIPEEERVKRLGDSVDRTAILALAGDSNRGRLIFSTNAAVQCKTCHKAGNVGENVGPDLTRIGTKYNKAALLDQVLDPSKTIEPAFITHLVEIKDGRVLSGLLVEKTKDAVVIKDVKGKMIKVPIGGDRPVCSPVMVADAGAIKLRDLTASRWPICLSSWHRCGKAGTNPQIMTNPFRNKTTKVINIINHNI